MSFVLATDTSANLSKKYIDRYNLVIVPLSYYINDVEYSYPDPSQFDGQAFFDLLRQKVPVRTSLVNTQRFCDAFTPSLEQGNDILYVGMSSGISSSYASACVAAQQLREQFPDRRILTVDTLAASLGEGLLVLLGAELREQGKTIEETAALLEQRREDMRQCFTVDDLLFLRRGGRISGASALLGTLLSIKPLLRGNRNGEIVLYGKARGGNGALRALADNYAQNVADPASQTVGIAHGGCPERAEALAEMLREQHPPREIMIECYEPVTGSHVGPGTVALFFWGNGRID